MHGETWISSAAFAEAEQISVQAARAALRAASAGRPWRGRNLSVRVASGKGGRRGLCYQVRASLPSTAEDTPRPGATPKADPNLGPRLNALQPVLDTSPGSEARAIAVAHAAETLAVSRRTTYRWLKRYEAEGVRGLRRRAPSNAGKPRVAVSRPFDRAFLAAGYDADLLQNIRCDLQKCLRGLWASRAEQAGAAEICRLAEHALLELCEARDVRLPSEALRLSRRYVEAFSAYRVINQRRNDRRAFDNGKPRIRRDWTDLLPMERVVADVKHLDVIVQRADGSTAWPKIIAFMDAGTGRVFAHPVLLERGEGIRQEHVIEAFMAMVAAPNWGFPQGLYLDNGPEFGALSKIDSALQLLNAPGARTLIYARPYNAAAKPIESLFARLDRQVFCLLPGYAGPNRMATKTQTLGRLPLPYPGDWSDFCKTLEGLIAAHHHRPVGGARKGRSPESWFAQRVAQGWRPASVAPTELDAAFSNQDNRRVDRGVLKIHGKRYTHERLAALPSRTSVDLALPWRRGAPPLARIQGSWVYLEPEKLYPARWIEGATASSARQRRQSAHVTGLAREAPAVDPVALKIRWGARQSSAEAQAGQPALDLGNAPRERADGIAAERAKPTTPTEAERKRAQAMALTERLERKQARDE
ncbi:MAG: leucine zipper domain-containing protein [Phenylobacterium sp.]|nr:leucine zipper domain-containing protein [Phenylobacterium sp.]